eukprot:12055830-Ditylum_brightwellii.AAC.1
MNRKLTTGIKKTRSQDKNIQVPSMNHTGHDDVNSQLAEIRQMIKSMAHAQSNFGMPTQGQGYHANKVAQQQTHAYPPFQNITNTPHRQQYQQGGYNNEGQYRNHQFQSQYQEVG